MHRPLPPKEKEQQHRQLKSHRHSQPKPAGNVFSIVFPMIINHKVAFNVSRKVHKNHTRFITDCSTTRLKAGSTDLLLLWQSCNFS
jgi:hypothetical protein